METNYGNLCSWFYDIDKPFPPKEELDFYLSFANKNMDILEPMCGSGRILIEFAKREFNIDGFDLSNDMIERCYKKLGKAMPNCNIICCDFAQYNSDKKYNLIYIPSCSFSLILYKNEILNSLNKLKTLMTIDGKVILPVLTIETAINNDFFSNGENKLVKTVREKDFRIDFIKINSIYNENENIFYSKTSYELYVSEKLVKSENEPFNIKCYNMDEMEKYIKSLGLKIKGKYCDYIKTQYTGQKAEMLIYEITY